MKKMGGCGDVRARKISRAWTFRYPLFLLLLGFSLICVQCNPEKIESVPTGSGAGQVAQRVSDTQVTMGKIIWQSFRRSVEIAGPPLGIVAVLLVVLIQRRQKHIQETAVLQEVLRRMEQTRDDRARIRNWVMDRTSEFMQEDGKEKVTPQLAQDYAGKLADKLMEIRSRPASLDDRSGRHAPKTSNPRRGGRASARPEADETPRTRDEKALLDSVESVCRVFDILGLFDRRRLIARYFVNEFYAPALCDLWNMCLREYVNRRREKADRGKTHFWELEQFYRRVMWVPYHHPTFTPKARRWRRRPRRRPRKKARETLERKLLNMYQVVVPEKEQGI